MKHIRIIATESGIEKEINNPLVIVERDKGCGYIRIPLKDHSLNIGFINSDLDELIFVLRNNRLLDALKEYSFELNKEE